MVVSVYKADRSSLRMIEEQNPEAAMVHQPEMHSYAAMQKRLGHAFGGPRCLHREACAACMHCVTHGACEALHAPSAAFFDLPMNQGAIPVGTPITVLPRTDKPESGTLPGFDSEAHRSFMRGLG